MREFSQNMDANADFDSRIGMEFDTLEDAWEFWVKYGRQVGFDVRKHYINKSKNDGKVTSRGFVCEVRFNYGLTPCVEMQMFASKHNTFLVCKKLINGKFNYSEIFSCLFKFKM